MHLAEKGGKLGGREIQLVKLDDESKPELGLQNADRLIKRDNVDVLIGTVHSGVQMAIHKAVTESGTLCIVPNAGAVAVTRNLCAKNVFRTSFSNWQPAYGMGVALGKRGVKKAVWITWDYAAGARIGRRIQAGSRSQWRTGRADADTANSRETNFQPLLAQVPGLGVDAVGAFFAGGGASTSSRTTRPPASRCRWSVPASSPKACSARRVPPPKASKLRCTTATVSTIRRTTRFRTAFKAKAGRDADVYAVQGYDSAQLLGIGLEAVKGNLDR